MPLRIYSTAIQQLCAYCLRFTLLTDITKSVLLHRTSTYVETVEFSEIRHLPRCIIITITIFMVPQSNLEKYSHIDAARAIGITANVLADQEGILHVFGQNQWIENLAGEPMPIREQEESDVSYTSRLTVWFQGFKAALVYAENNKHSSPAERNLRRIFRNDPIFNGAATGIDSDNYDVNKNDRFSPAQITTVQRQRVYNEIPVGAYLMIMAQILAHDEGARNYVNDKTSKSSKIPRVLKEYLQSVRRSTCGKFRITPVVRPFFDDDVLSRLGLEKTIFDTKWLTTVLGVSACFDVFARIANHPDNYINFDSFDSAIQFESGYTTTLTALTAVEGPAKTRTATIDYKNRLDAACVTTGTVIVPSGADFINILPGNSYGESPNFVHVLDTQVFNMYLERKNNPFIFTDHSVDIRLRNSSQQYALYFVMRGTGEMHNRVTNDRISNPRPKQIDTSIAEPSGIEKPIGLDTGDAITSQPAQAKQSFRRKGDRRSFKPKSMNDLYRNKFVLNSPLSERDVAMARSLLYGVLRVLFS